MQDLVESYDGTTWTETTDFNTARKRHAGSGTQTAGLLFGGDVSPGASALTETWNGTSWTEVNDLNTARMSLGGTTGGTNTDTLAFAGGASPSPPFSALVEQWDGTSWTETTNVSTGRRQPAGIGTAASGLAVGGDTGSVSNATEEWNMAASVETVAFD